MPEVDVAAAAMDDEAYARALQAKYDGAPQQQRSNHNGRRKKRRGRSKSPLCNSASNSTAEEADEEMAKRLAQEAKDAEMARKLQRKEKKRALADQEEAAKKEREQASITAAAATTTTTTTTAAAAAAAAQAEKDEELARKLQTREKAKARAASAAAEPEETKQDIDEDEAKRKQEEADAELARKLFKKEKRAVVTHQRQQHHHQQQQQLDSSKKEEDLENKKKREEEQNKKKKEAEEEEQRKRQEAADEELARRLFQREKKRVRAAAAAAAATASTSEDANDDGDDDDDDDEVKAERKEEEKVDEERKQQQELADAELARRLQKKEKTRAPPSTDVPAEDNTETDEEMARRLEQELRDEELARRLSAQPTMPPPPQEGSNDRRRRRTSLIARRAKNQKRKEKQRKEQATPPTPTLPVAAAAAAPVDTAASATTPTNSNNTSRGRAASPKRSSTPARSRSPGIVQSHTPKPRAASPYQTTPVATTVAAVPPPPKYPEQPPPKYSEQAPHHHLYGEDADAYYARKLAQEERDEALARNVARQQFRRVSVYRDNGPGYSSGASQNKCTFRRIISLTLPLVVILAAVVGLVFAFSGGDGLPSLPGTEPIFRDKDPFNGQLPDPSSARRWHNDGEGLSLEILNALQSRWDTLFEISFSEWDMGNPDALTLSQRRVAVDPSCKPVDGVMKVCNGDYGDTRWLGVNIVTTTNGFITNSIAQLNEYYLSKRDDAVRQYTLCHEMGHGFGLPHTDENFYNEDLGNCMDYTNNAKANKSPDQSNYIFLFELYGLVNVRGNRRRRRRRQLLRRHDLFDTDTTATATTITATTTTSTDPDVVTIVKPFQGDDELLQKYNQVVKEVLSSQTESLSTTAKSVVMHKTDFSEMVAVKLTDEVTVEFHKLLADNFRDDDWNGLR